MPVVTTPPHKGSQKQSVKTFNWLMENVFHVSSQVIVGSSPGASNYYGGGTPKNAGIYTDSNVSHPGNNKYLGCFTRPVYYKIAGGPPCTDLSRITSFTSNSG